MLIKKTSGGKEIIETGSIILYDTSSNLSLEVKCSETFSFSLIIAFQKKGDKRDVDVTVENNKITLVCNNFENIMGTGILSPIELATFNGKKIFVNFWVCALGDSGFKRVDYTLYMEI